MNRRTKRKLKLMRYYKLFLKNCPEYLRFGRRLTFTYGIRRTYLQGVGYISHTLISLYGRFPAGETLRRGDVVHICAGKLFNALPSSGDNDGQT